MNLKSELAPLTLVMGGANSGKSKTAEDMVMATGLPRTYIATAQAWDDEMKVKIAAHRVQRGPDWTTVEASLDIAAALDGAADGVILLDCLTLWLTNLMLDGADLDLAFCNLVKALKRSPNPVIVVSNEVGQGITPDNAMARAFVKHQGHLNQKVAQAADHVVFVTAGISQVLK